MADFLTRLVERNMGAASEVRPLIAPIFAPAPPLAEDVTLEPAPAAERPGRAPVAAMPAAQAPGPAPAAAPPGPSAVAAPARAPLPPLVPPAAQRPGPELPAARSLEEAGAEPRAEVDVAAQPARPAEGPAPRPAEAIGQSLVVQAAPLPSKLAAGPEQRDTEAAQLSRAGDVAPPAARRQALVERESVTQPAPSDGMQVATAPAHQHESMPLVEQPQGTRPRSDSMALVRPQPSVSPERAAAPTPATPQAPTIRVSIGRIEVRAVSAPAPQAPARPARPAPKMSLDEYLRAQKGGKR